MSSRNWSSVHDHRNFMKTEWFFKIEHVVLFTAWNQQAQTLFKLRNIPSSVESFSLSFLKKFWKVCYIFHQCDIQLFANQMIFYWTRYWSIFFFCFFTFEMTSSLCKNFWNIFELFSPRFLQVQRSRMVSPVNFFVEHSNNFKRVKHKNSSSFVHTPSSMTWA